MDFDASRRLAKALIAAYNDDADPKTVADAVHVSRPLDDDFSEWLAAICRQAAVLYKADHTSRASRTKGVVR